MAGNTLGTLFRLTTFGESHGTAIGAVIDGCPAGLEINVERIQRDLDLRKPGQSSITTQRKESDTVQIISGIFEGKSTGAPIALLIPNEDQRSKDYSHNTDTFRPSHADYTYQTKYGMRDYRGGGRSSARETAARVAAGAIAKQLLQHYNIEVFASVIAVGPITAPQVTDTSIATLFKQREENIVRCANQGFAESMIDLIEKTRKAGDTVGGKISCIVRSCPAGLGEPVFDKLHADLGKAMLSINAAHAFEYGSGFAGTEMFGSEHNDIPAMDGAKYTTKTNHAGGILGGISNGEEIYFTVGFKPVATIMHAQETINAAGESAEIKGKGRHDPCVVPRAVVIVEAMAALVLADHLLRNKLSKL